MKMKKIIDDSDIELDKSLSKTTFSSSSESALTLESIKKDRE